MESMKLLWDTQDIMNRTTASKMSSATRILTLTVFAGCCSLSQAANQTRNSYAESGSGKVCTVQSSDHEGEITLKDLRAVAPTVTTTAISNLAGTSATSGGNVTGDGGSGVTARGVCWSTSSNPTTADSKTTDGTGTGAFTSSITGLSPGTTYHVRAYATNGAGTGYGSDVEFTTLLVLDASAGSSTYIAGGSAVVVDSALTLSATSVTGFRVLIQTNFQTGDVLAFNSGSLPGGVNGSYNSSTSTLTFTGTASAADWQTLLRTVTFSTSSSNTSTRTVTFSAGGASPLSSNGHFYEFVASAAITWPNANTAANNRKLFGLQGYLATVTSAAENSFVVSKLAGQGWIGASDAGAESVWRWVTGPEGTEDSGNGRKFFTQTSASASSVNLVGVYGSNTPGGGVAFGGQYINWSTDEPNDSPSEDFAHYLGTGYWNDYAFNNNSIAGYVVEYGGMTGDPAQQLYDSKNVLVLSDTDGDGTADVNDGCPNDATKTAAGICGCGTPDTDSDSDGTADCLDACPYNASFTTPGPCGCGTCPPTDSDGDGSPDYQDNCPSDPSKDQPGLCGCGVPDTDTDSDGTPDCNDQCPNDPNKTEPGSGGCASTEADDAGDTDGDGSPDANDACPDDPDKSEPGLCGCGVSDTDSDDDGTPDCNDLCPQNPDMISPGPDGCGIGETDSDGDGTPDSIDSCPDDPGKVTPGETGCGNAEADSDGDGVPDSVDICPNDPDKIMPGLFGCGVTETDTDGDGTPDDLDGCPSDPNKTAPGTAGCGVGEIDTDGDGVPDSEDDCPNDPHKAQPGNLGCGQTEAPDIQLSVDVDDDQDDGEDDSGTPAAASVGDQISARVYVRNIGTGNATNVWVELPIPPNTEFLFAQLILTGEEPAQMLSDQLEAVVDGDTVHIYVGDVPVAYEIAFQIALRAIEAGDVVIAPEAGSAELSERATTEPAEARVKDDQFVQVITTGPAPCGVLGAFSFLTVFCTLLYFRCRR